MTQRPFIGGLAWPLVACADGPQDSLVVSISRVHPAGSEAGH
jgi:hypothetical protein